MRVIRGLKSANIQKPVHIYQTLVTFKSFNTYLNGKIYTNINLNKIVSIVTQPTTYITLNIGNNRNIHIHPFSFKSYKLETVVKIEEKGGEYYLSYFTSKQIYIECEPKNTALIERCV